MAQAVISLGSNVDDKESILAHAMQQMNNAGIGIVESTAPYMDPVDNQPTHPYLNIVAIIETSLSHDHLRTCFKEMERRHGRDAHLDENGRVPLDIDIVIYDGITMRPQDAERPYFIHGYSILRP